MQCSAIIEKFFYGSAKLQLSRPYKLSFTVVKELISHWVYVEDADGRFGIGEAVPLFGYGHETSTSIKCFYDFIKDKIKGRTADELHDELVRYQHKCPFAVSAIRCALDFRLWQNRIKDIKSLDLVYPISAANSSDLVFEQIRDGLQKGFKDFKVKIGRDLDTDLITVDILTDRFFDDVTFRFDANQGYMLEQALVFCKSLEKKAQHNILWLEQPFGVEDWEKHKELCHKTFIPIMLDESIYTFQDIIHAAEIGCKAVKLKLCKNGGLVNCFELLKICREMELYVTLGNGVSTDIGNLAEALVVNAGQEFFNHAVECNGFVKLIEPFVFDQLVNRKGNLSWPAHLISMRQIYYNGYTLNRMKLVGKIM